MATTADFEGQLSANDDRLWLRAVAAAPRPGSKGVVLADDPTHVGSFRFSDLDLGGTYGLEQATTKSGPWTARPIVDVAANAAITALTGNNFKMSARKPVVSGSKSANAALGSLMTALVQLGLITDSTS